MSQAVSAVSATSGIELRDLGQSYILRDAGKKSEFVALAHFNLQIKAGEFVAIVGPSGCGKSTLLDIVSGLAKPKQGEILIDGRTVSGPDLDRGFIMQGYALFPWRTVRKNVEYGLEVKGVPKRERPEICRHFIHMVGLSGFENRYPNQLSGGMRQRVAIARALAFDPKILLMDEPFAAVDAQTRETLQDELMQIWAKTGKTVLFVTHSIDEAVLLADRVVVMGTRPGRVYQTLAIDLPRPRTAAGMRVSAEFGWITRKVWELLQEGQGYMTPETTPKTSVSDVAEQISAQVSL
ncbi:MAG: ABC transporter ATP-binding protein [Peptococcaceae bacterium]|jgi:NitT/TauT family transport system ATP-binding protein|nr:ABC transporter ATP-binding protein [Peptococcaceae bacterium]